VFKQYGAEFILSQLTKDYGSAAAIILIPQATLLAREINHVWQNVREFDPLKE